MLNVNIWIKEPFPFQWKEVESLQEAIKRMYGVKVTYTRLHGATCYYDMVEIDDVTITTAKQIAASLKLFHLQKAIAEYRSHSRVNAEDVDIEILGRKDSPPEWARTN